MSSKANALQLFCLLWGLALIADHAIQAQTQTPQTCAEANGISFDIDQFAGIWWEVAREPSNSYFCTEVNITVVNTTESNVVLIETTYSNTVDYPWVNQTMNATLSYNGSQEETSFNFTYWNPPNYTPYTTFKILETDYTDYAIICGYTNASDDSTSFGVLLARDRTPNTTVLLSWETKGANISTDFQAGLMTVITQDDTCYSVAGANPTTVLSTICFALSFLIFVYLK